MAAGCKMPCYHPLKAYQSAKGPNGKCKIYFRNSGNLTLSSIKLPCGQCIGCRLERSRQWALRCIHESSLYTDNCFITLTYDDEHLPWDRSVNHMHFQKFMKRLRKKNNEKKIRYYQCGEYGQATPENDFIARPHYHACIFNHDFEDKEIFKETEGIVTYSSDTLDNIWGKGFCTVGDVTMESAAYCARYIMKKVNGKRKEEYYEKTDEITGEIINLTPEYNTMSRGARKGEGGIGKRWFDEYHKDVYPKDYVTKKGRKLKPPKYYDLLYEVFEPEGFRIIKENRKIQIELNKKDSTPKRLADREKVKAAQLAMLTRQL